MPSSLSSNFNDELLTPHVGAAKRVLALKHAIEERVSLEQARTQLNSATPNELPDKLEYLLMQAISSHHKLVIDFLVDHGAKSNDLTLHNCVNTGNKLLVLSQLRAEPDLEAKNELSRTPLIQATVRGFAEIASVLIDAGADVNKRDNIGMSSLDYAILEGDIKIIRLLLRANARANIPDGTYKLEPVFLALCHGSNRAAVIKLLIMKYISLLNRQNKNGLTPLAVATKLGQSAVVDVLLGQESIIVNPRDKTTKQTPLHLAARKGDARVAASLLAKRASVDAKDYNNQTPLYLACEQGHVNCVHAILDQGKPNKKEKYNLLALRVAICSYGQTYDEIVELLTEYGIFPTREFAHDPEILHASVKNGYMKIVLTLLQFGANVDNMKDGRTLLHNAVLGNQENIVKLLINRGADINAKCALGKTPLYYSEERSYNAITKQLLDNSTDIRDENQLLHKAVGENKLNECKSMLRHSDLNAYDDSGKSPIHYVTSVEMLDLLMEHGVNINRPSETGATLLHLTATLGDKELVSAILRHGGDIFARDLQNRTALFMAKKYNRKEVEDLLTGAHVRSLLEQQRDHDAARALQQRASNRPEISVINLPLASTRMTSESNSNN